MAPSIASVNIRCTTVLYTDVLYILMHGGMTSRTVIHSIQRANCRCDVCYSQANLIAMSWYH